LLSLPQEPLFYSDWERAVFIHYEVDPQRLQRDVPFALDLRNGRAYLSLVAFTMRNMRPRVGGPLTRWLFKPIGTHDFLNVRTYVRHRGEPGIYFLAEWLSNRWSVKIGPHTFGLPYRFGHLNYEHFHERGELQGEILNGSRTQRLSYRAWFRERNAFCPSPPGTLEEFLLERYTAFTRRGKAERFFRIWHPRWRQASLDVMIEEDSLLRANWPWFSEARLMGANYSPGVENVWMGWPHGISKLANPPGRSVLSAFWEMP